MSHPKQPQQDPLQVNLERIRQKLEQSLAGLQTVVDQANDPIGIAKSLAKVFIAGIDAQHEIALQLAEMNTRDTAAEVRMKTMSDFMNGVLAEVQKSGLVIPGISAVMKGN